MKNPFRVILIALFLVCPVAFASGQGQQRPFGMNAYGVGSNFSQYNTVSQWQQDIGVQASRVAFNWYWIQTDAALPDKTPTFAFTDPIVSTLASRGIEIIGVLSSPPDWASSGSGQPDYFHWPPNDLNEWETYVRAVVSRYKNDVHTWQVWNEPNNDVAWQPAASATDYVALLQRTHAAIKGPGGEDPSAQIIVGGISGVNIDFLKDIYDLGAWPLIDIVAVHPYMRDDPPEVYHRIDSLLRLRAWVAQVGLRPIWYSEIGWPTTPYVSGVSEATQADYLVRDYVQSIGLDADRAFWWNFRDVGTDPNGQDLHHGLLRFDNTQKTSYSVYQTMTSQLAGATFWRKRPSHPHMQSVIDGFEADDAWTVTPWPPASGTSGNFTRTAAERMGGAFSRALTYSFPAPAGNGTLVSLQRSIPIPGTPKKFRMWVKSNDGDHRVSIDFVDNGGEIFRLRMGFTIGTRWEQLEAHLDDPDPTRLVSLGGDGTVHYPITFDRFLLESFQIPEYPFYGNLSGTVYFDDLVTEEGDSLITDYQFTKGDGFIDVAWTTELGGGPRNVPFPAPSLTVTNVGGGQSVVTDGGGGDLDGIADGYTTIAVTGSPKFVAYSGNAAYVLDGYGGVHPGAVAAAGAANSPYFGFDAGRDIELLPNGDGYYVLDGFGGVSRGLTAPDLVPNPTYFGFDIARDLEIVPGPGAYVLDGYGGVHPAGGAPVITPATVYFGFDIARDLEILPAGGGYYVLDGFGGVHAGGSAAPLTPSSTYFGFDIAKDMELLPNGTGYYVLDGYGGVHTGGSAAVLSPATPYFGFDIARAIALDGSTGLWVLDGFGGVHPTGSAQPLSPATPYFGFDIAKDLEVR